MGAPTSSTKQEALAAVLTHEWRPVKALLPLVPGVTASGAAEALHTLYVRGRAERRQAPNPKGSFRWEFRLPQ